jgi:hypothetical protein
MVRKVGLFEKVGKIHEKCRMQSEKATLRWLFRPKPEPTE